MKGTRLCQYLTSHTNMDPRRVKDSVWKEKAHSSWGVGERSRGSSWPRGNTDREGRTPSNHSYHRPSWQANGMMEGGKCSFNTNKRLIARIEKELCAANQLGKNRNFQQKKMGKNMNSQCREEKKMTNIKKNSSSLVFRKTQKGPITKYIKLTEKRRTPDHGYIRILAPCWWKQKGGATLKKGPAVLPRFGVCTTHATPLRSWFCRPRAFTLGSARGHVQGYSLSVISGWEVSGATWGNGWAEGGGRTLWSPMTKVGPKASVYLQKHTLIWEVRYWGETKKSKWDVDYETIFANSKYMYTKQPNTAC